MNALTKDFAAYLAFAAAWGSLVPIPLLVSESWSGWIKFISLQLGRDPVPGDETSEWRSVGFRLSDADVGNMIFVFDEKTKLELVAIDLDLESYTTIIGTMIK